MQPIQKHKSNTICRSSSIILPSLFTIIFAHHSIFFAFPNGQPTMSSSRGYSGSRGSQSYSISRDGESRRPVRTQPNGLEPFPVMLPTCGCCLPMKIYIANTYTNQGRRFWKCRNWNSKVSLAFLSDNVLCFFVLYLV